MNKYIRDYITKYKQYIYVMTKEKQGDFFFLNFLQDWNCDFHIPNLILRDSDFTWQITRFGGIYLFFECTA